MIYFDSTYVARMYVLDRGSAEVRALAANQQQIVCSELGKIEVSSVLHRKFREGALNAAEHQVICAQFEQDIRTAFWTWIPVTTAALEQVRVAFGQLPPSVFLRAVDALHLTCAREAGLQEIYSNDRHLLTAAGHFGLRGINVIPV